MDEAIFDKLVDFWEGVPFKHKGRDKMGIDCSFLLVKFLNDYYEKVGSNFRIILPKSLIASYDQHFFLRHNSVGRSKIKEICDSLPNLEEKKEWQRQGLSAIKKGDLLIFPRGKCPGGHGGLCYKDGNPSKYLASVHPGGVKKFSLNVEQPRYVYTVDYSYGLEK